LPFLETWRGQKDSIVAHDPGDNIGGGGYVPMLLQFF